jgi:NTE family protein
MANGGPNGEKRVDLVFEGGGVKGIALAGAYSVLEDRGFEVQNVAGASAGAIVGSLVTAGYSAKELHDLLEATPFSSFMDKGWEDKIIGLGIPISILKDHGIYEGKVFLDWIKDKLAGKGISTFGDLRNPGEVDPRWQYRLQVVVSDVTTHSLLLLPRDAEQIGRTADDLEVADAVHMSMAMPIFFEPVTVQRDGQDVVLVDGGMLSNFPVWVFDSDGVPEWPTFGLKLVDPDPKQQQPGEPTEVPVKHNVLKNLVGYLLDLVSTMTDAHDKLYLERDSFVRTITISNLGVKATQFNLSKDTAEALYKSGQEAAQTFLSTWDFDAYKAAFRSGAEQPTRRDVVTSRMRAAVTSTGDTK